ncbi:MAG: phosphoglucosamine mutase [Bacteroidales bacterium]|nr:phosphoglucosamine mutase [Bacteroidales bacterium]
MTLIKSISGIRGTIGGKSGEGLSPHDLVMYTAAFATFISRRREKDRIKILIGRDARISGRMVSNIVTGTLQAMGVDVVDVDLTTTPTAEIAVTHLKCDAGIILTASHNPRQWNALKLLNHNGEFLSAADGAEVLRIANNGDYTFAAVEKLGKHEINLQMFDRHIEMILALPDVDKDAISKAGFKVVVDTINSTGSLVIPDLLKALGVKVFEMVNGEPNGQFAHNPEPLPEHLSGICELMNRSSFNVGFVVDPDVDRLAIVSENGEVFGEEYTLVAVADYILQRRGGNTVSNLSSSMALRDVTLAAGYEYHASAVGEVNVVEKMKEVNAVIGGEGNGGVILPELHYGRDALVGIALFLSHLAKSGKSCSALRASYPSYFISKNKIELLPEMDISSIMQAMRQKYSNYPLNDIDGLRFEIGKEWVHLRQSNTEPIIRIYAEADSQGIADRLGQKIKDDIREIAMQR